MKKSVAVSLSLLALTLQTFFVVFYVSRERTYFYWDLSMYHAYARDLVMTSGFEAKAAKFFASFSQNYNLLFSLPSVLAMELFGTSRLVFIMAHFLAFLVPLEMIAALFLRRLLALSFPEALALALCVAPTVIPLWTPLFEGFPDAASAFLFAVALFTAAFGFQTTRRALGVGVLLGLAVVLRRHFAYAVVAFYPAFALTQLPCRARWVREGGLAFLSGLVVGLVILALEPTYVHTVLTTSFRDLYKSYEEPFGVFSIYVGSTFGLLSLSLSSVGLIWACLRAKEASYARFLGFFALLWFFVWGLGPSQLGPHHLMPVLPLAALVGTASFFFVVQGSRRRLLQISAATLLTTQALWCLVVAPSTEFTKVPGPLSFWAEPHPPLIRGDYDTLARLAKDLTAMTGPQDKVVIVGSSPILNQDLLRAVLTDRLHDTTLLPRLLFAPEVDHNQGPPYDVVAGGTLFVVPTPSQYHLNPAGQKVVTALARQFPPNDVRVKAFTLLPQTYALDQDVHLALWRRREHWTPGQLVDALSLVQSIAGGAQDWVVSEPVSQSLVQPTVPGRANVLLPFPLTAQRAGLFFRQPLTRGAYRLGMMLLGGCSVPTASLLVQDESGRVLHEENFAPLSLPSPLFHLFKIETDTPAYLTLRLRVPDGPACTLGLQNLRVEKTVF
jgi:hypothetical protein